MSYHLIETYLNPPTPKHIKSKKRIHAADFIIPKPHEYMLVLKLNYTLNQLKQICVHYALTKSGTKSYLITKIYNMLRFTYNAVKIQRFFRHYIVKKINRLRGPACLDRSICVNETDFFTMDSVTKIAPQQFYSFKDKNGFIYGFDILSLWQLFLNPDGGVNNPYNMQPFPATTYNNLLKLIRLSPNTINIVIKNDAIDLEKELDFRIISLFQFINSLGHYTNHRWFNNLNNIQIINWCSGLSDIWFYRAQISNQVKARIYPHGNPFISLTRPLSTNMSLYTLRKTCVGICENLIYSGINNDDKNMGAYYVLTSLTLQSSDAAVALPWLFQSVI